MSSLYTILLLLLVPMQLLNIKAASRCNRRLMLQDLDLIAKSNRGVAINERTPTSSIELKTIKKQTFDKSKKYYLLMDDIQLKQSPEGVYEIYLSPSDTDSAKLVSESSYFIDVLDTYTIGNRPDKNRLLIDVSKQLSDQNRNSQQLLDYMLTIAFRGNLKPDSTSASNAGALSIGSIHLLQTVK